MKALIQRVSQASVTVDEKCIGQINSGLLVLLAVEQGDTLEQAEKMAYKICHYRVFSDNAGKMNLNVQQAGGALLVVSQFTLAADTESGLRPSFTAAAEPGMAKYLYEYVVAQCQQYGLIVETGQFAAHMDVALNNNGPVTFMLQT